MARVEIVSQAWGWLADEHGNGLSTVLVTVNNLDGTAATHYSAITGGTSSTGVLTTNSDGTLPRFIEEGSYLLSAPGIVDRRVEAIAGVTVAVLREAPINVQYPEYGAQGLGSSSVAADTAAFQAAAAVGAPVFVPPAEYHLNGQVLPVAETAIHGGGKESTLVKVAAGASITGGLFQATNVAGFELRDLTIDLNKANTTSAGSDTQQQAVYLVSSNTTGITRARIVGVRVVNAERIAVYGTSSSTSNPLEITVDIDIEDATRQGLLITRPSYLSGRVRALRCGDANSDQIQVGINGTDGGSNIDLVAEAHDGGRNGVTFLGVSQFKLDSYTTGNANQGTVLSEGVRDFHAFVRSHDNTGINFSLDPRTSGVATLKDVEGIVVAEVSGSGSHGVFFNYARGVDARIVARNNTDDGIKLVSCEAATVVGQAIANTDRGVSVVDGTGTGSGPGGRNYVNVLTSGNGSAFEDTGTVKTDFTGCRDHAGIPSVASANSMTLPTYGDAVTVTGTASILSITASWVGRRVLLLFTGTAAGVGVTDGSNLKLAGSFAFSPDDVMELWCDGTNWYEVGRNAN